MLRSLLILVAAASAAAPPAVATPALATYVVTFDAPPAVDQMEILSGVALSAHAFTHLPAAVAVVSPADAGVLARLPGVRAAYPSATYSTQLRQSVGRIRADAAWSLGYDGAGVGIAVVDTGIDGTHPDLCAAAVFCNGTPVKTVQNVKVIGRQDVAVDPVVTLEGQITTDTSSGHGTHVAGIAAGAGTASVHASRYRGVAPGAHLVGLGTGELLTVENVLGAFDWIIENRARYNIRVVNNSWGPDPGTRYDPEDPVQRAIATMWDRGLSIVFGSGNAGPRGDVMNAFSANPRSISVAGGSKDGHIAPFSSRGVPGSSLWRPTVTAPGYQIVAPRAATGFVADVGDTSAVSAYAPDPLDAPRYAEGSGTSMASPHVAGVVALMQQAAFQARGRYLTPAEVKNILQNTAVSRDPARGPGGLPNYQGYSMGAGYVDARTAAQAAAAGTHDYRYDDGVTYDVRPYTGALGASGWFVASSFAVTHTVAPGAISLDVSADWGVAGNDVDIELYGPSGALAGSTWLACDPSKSPNGYSSFCTAVANERLTVVAPAPGTWRAVVKGFLSAPESVRGLWSVAYPDGAAPPDAQTASVSLVASATSPTAPGSVDLTATVRDALGLVEPGAPVAWSEEGSGALDFGESETRSDGTARARTSSVYGGTQTITATSGGHAATVAIEWMGPPPPPDRPQSTPGAASGGGWILDPAKKTFGFGFEYEQDAGAPGGDLSFDDHEGTKVKAVAVDSLVVDGTRATVTGTATVNGVAGYRFTLDVEDRGSPGRNGDTFRLVVTSDSDPGYRYESGGPLRGGNVVVQTDG